MVPRLAAVPRYAVYSTVLMLSLLLAGCGSSYPPAPSKTAGKSDPRYIIGPGDQLNVVVWDNPEVSSAITVPPDGVITTPLVEDLPATGKTSTELARDIEDELRAYIKDPVVTVIVSGFVGPYDRQVRVVGAATEPQTLQYREGMTALDVMIEVGGLSEFAAGNDATILRERNGKRRQYNVRLNDLIQDGDVSANVPMRPGDVLIIPESFL